MGPQRGRAKGFFEEGHPDALGASDFLERCRTPRLALDHLGEHCQPDRDDPAVFGKSLDRIGQEGLLIPGERPIGFRQTAECPAELDQDLAGVDEVEEIDEGCVLAQEDFDPKVTHEACERNPEVVPHRDEALDALAVALPQRLGQLGFLFPTPGMEPLLELVDDEHDLLIGAQAPPLPERGDRVREVELPVQVGELFPQPTQNSRLGLPGRCLDVDRHHPTGEAGEQPGVDQRRLAAAAGPVDHAHRKARVVEALDPVLPEPDALRKAVLVWRARQKLQKKIAVVFVERPQPFGNNGNPRLDSSRIRLTGQLGRGGPWLWALGGALAQGIGLVDLDVPVDDIGQLRERLLDVCGRDCLAPASSAVLAQPADQRRGIELAGQAPLAVESLDQAFQRPRAGWFVEPRIVDVFDHQLEHFAGSAERHLWVVTCIVDRRIDACADSDFFPEAFPCLGSAGRRRRENRVLSGPRRRCETRAP